MIPDGIVRAIDRRVTAGELHREIERSISEEEREEVLALVRWFIHRYPSAESRLTYVRQAYARWRPPPK